MNLKYGASNGNNNGNHKNYNFLDCDWFKKLLFSTNALAKLLSDSSISQSHSKCSLNQPITFKRVV